MKYLATLFLIVFLFASHALAEDPKDSRITQMEETNCEKLPTLRDNDQAGGELDKNRDGIISWKEAVDSHHIFLFGLLHHQINVEEDDVEYLRAHYFKYIRELGVTPGQSKSIESLYTEENCELTKTFFIEAFTYAKKFKPYNYGRDTVQSPIPPQTSSDQ